MRAAVAALAVLPLALGGCSLALDLYTAQLQRAYGVPVRPAPNPLTDRAVTITGPITVAMGPQSVFAPANNRYLQDALAARLRRRFPEVAVMDSRPAASTGSTTVLQLDTTRDSSNAQPAVVHAVVRVYDSGRSMQSIIDAPVAVDLKQPDLKASIDELLTGLDAKLDTSLFRK